MRAISVHDPKQALAESSAGPLDDIFHAYREGNSALLVTGRSLYDLDADQGKLRPLLEILRRHGREKHGLLLVTYSLARGLDWGEVRLRDARDRQTVSTILRSHDLLDLPQDENEAARVMRGISSLVRTPTDGLKWADGSALRFAIVFEFSEHLIPGGLSNGTQTDSQLLAIELAHLTARSLALRNSRNLVVFHGRESLLDELVSSALHPVRLRFPQRAEKLRFLETARKVYSGSTLEEELGVETVAHLAANTPNRGLEGLLRASHYSGESVRAAQVSAQKQRDVEEVSEQTLAVLDTGRVENLDLRGKTIERPLQVLSRYAQSLREGRSCTPANVVLVGPPGTGKTDLALLTARQARTVAYSLLSPKGGIVGETERKARLQQVALREWVPNVAFVDEITESLPLERSDFDGDSGASRAVMAALLTALSDESRRGRSLLIATTNCPWRMGAAMQSRFTFIPVLGPLEQDFPQILISLALRLDPSTSLTVNCESVSAAAAVFFQKGATPRHMLAALNHQLLLHGGIDEAAVLVAADDLCPPPDRASCIYADLWAIRCCTSKSFFPWSSDPRNFPYPAHLQGVIDPENGEIRQSELTRKIEELRPHAKV